MKRTLLSVLFTITAAAPLQSQERSKDVISEWLGSSGIGVQAVVVDASAWVEISTHAAGFSRSIRLTPADARLWARQADSVMHLDAHAHRDETVTYKLERPLPRFTRIVSEKLDGAAITIGDEPSEVSAVGTSKQIRGVIEGVQRAADTAAGMLSRDSSGPARKADGVATGAIVVP